VCARVLVVPRRDARTHGAREMAVAGGDAEIAVGKVGWIDPHWALEDSTLDSESLICLRTIETPTSGCPEGHACCRENARTAGLMSRLIDLCSIDRSKISSQASECDASMLRMSKLFARLSLDWTDIGTGGAPQGVWMEALPHVPGT